MLKPALEIVKDSFQLYAQNWRRFLPFIVMFVVPGLILSSLGTIFLYLAFLLPASAGLTNVIILLIIAATIVFRIWAEIGFTKTIYSAITNQPSHWKADFTSSSSLIGPVILSGILTFLIILGGTLLFIIPGIIFAVWYGFFHYTVILDNKRGMDALNASKALVIGRWAPIVWRAIVPALIFGLINFAISLVLSNISFLPIAPFIRLTVAALFVSAADSIIYPLYAAAALILYKNAKENPLDPEIVAPPTKI